MRTRTRAVTRSGGARGAEAGRLLRQMKIMAVAVGVPAAAAFLYFVPPGQEAPYPPCWFHALTGLHCPGCGSTRCLHALLHGDLGQAAAYNGLLLLALPFLLFWAVHAALRAWHGRPASGDALRGWPAFVIVLVLFGVLRNLPVAPFNLLAPHAL